MPEAGEVLQGRVVGQFHLGRYLGGSDHSAVFLTERLQGTPRNAAIKLIPANSATADLQLSRWKLISRLSHPHILQILEAGRCRQDGEELLYVVMEYAEENLAQILPHRPLTIDETREMLKPTLEALAYLHGRGFVHGHLKPSNILVCGEQLKLSSDGICRIGEMDSAGNGIERPPDCPGTAAAPAQDIWSLGVTLVQMLTQLLPVRNGNGHSGITLPETLPSQFVELAQNCLEADPQRRCTLEEIAQHLHVKLPVRTIGPPAPLAEPITAQRPRQPRPAGLAKQARRSSSILPAAAIILALMAIIGGATLFNRQSSPPDTPAAASEAPTLPPTPSEAGPASSPRGQITLQAAAPRKAPSPKHATLQTASEIGGVPLTASLKPGERVSPDRPISGEVLQQVLPDVPRNASNTIRGTVRVTVRVRVDPAGNVTGVNLISAGPSGYFARLAADAARQWKFSSARRGGQTVAGTWTVRFEFIRGGVHAFPVAAP